MNMINNIINTFKTHEPKSRRRYKESAVMILLRKQGGELEVLFQVRSMRLRSQPGDVCLPGGKLEKGEDNKDTAIRETMEELGINREDLEYIGATDYIENAYGYRIFPHIGLLKQDAIMAINKDEVDHVFWVPLKFFFETKPEGYDIGVGPTHFGDFPFHLIQNGKEYKFREAKNTKYFYRFGDYTIWGFTADVLRGFIEDLRSGDNGKELYLQGSTNSL